MADQSAQEQVDTSQAQMINLRILSPAFHISDAFNLGAISVETTIGELKDKISQLVPEHPPTNHQRLIYIGHVLANDADTLATVFAAQLLHQQVDFTIHLVVRPQLLASNPSTPSTPDIINTVLADHTLPNINRGGDTPVHHQDRLDTNDAVPAAPRPTHRPIVPPARLAPGMAAFMPPHGHPQNSPTNRQPPRLPPGAIPMNVATTTRTLPDGTTYTVRVANSTVTLHPPGAVPPGAVPPGAVPPGAVPPGALPPGTIPPGARPPGAESPGNRPPNRPRPTQEIHQHFGTHNQHTHHHAQAPGQFNIQHINDGQNEVENNAAPVTTNPQHQMLQQQMQQQMAQLQQLQQLQQIYMPRMPQPFVQHPAFLRPHHPAAHHPAFQPAQHPAFQPAPYPTFQPRQAARPLPESPEDINDVLEMGEYLTQLATGMLADPNIPPQARSSVNVLRTATDDLVNRVRNIHSRQPSSQQLPLPQPSQQAAPLQVFDATAPTVYLLSSPAGPHALLFTPQGAYTGTTFHTLPHQSPQPRFVTSGRWISEARHNQPGTPTPGQPQAGLPDPPLLPWLPNEPALQAAGQQVVQDLVQAQNNQPVDLLQQLQPLLGQFWLLIRIGVFAYFFIPSNQGWYRPAIMAIIALIFFFLSGDRMGWGVQDAIRRWWEGVVGLPARRQGQDQGQNNAPEAAAVAQPPRAEDDAVRADAVQPAAAEARQQEQHLSWLRQTLRPAERALALFVASLWPGVGERAGAARREEDDRLRRERQETLARLERMRREIMDDQEATVADLTAEAPPAAIGATTTTSHGLATEEGGVQSDDGQTSRVESADSAAAVATGAEVVDGGEALRERKAGPKAATVEEAEDDDGSEIIAAAANAEL